jgi:hypothetical protein
MESEVFATNFAQKIYNHYYKLANQTFDTQTSDYLAKIPADYVYKSAIETYPNCYINDRCCLEYCIDVLDDDFNRLDPEIKLKAYEKAYGIDAANINPSEINFRLKMKRRFLRNKFNDAVKTLRVQQENQINFSNLRITPKRKTEELENALKSIKLN